MTQEELDMMDRIHLCGKMLMLNDENWKLLRKMLEEFQNTQERVTE